MGSKKALVGLLTPPMLWLVVAYLGALAAIFATAFFTTDPFTNEVVPTFTTENFEALLSPTYLRIIGRTLFIAVMVTVLCIVIAVPFAYFMARVAHRRLRRLLVAAVLVPLWASYLVKAYAWRTMVQPGGVLDSTFGTTPGYGFAAVVLTLTYLWLPYMILPVYAGFERLPESHLEASADLGAKGLHTFRRVRHRVHVLAEPRRLHRRADRRRHAAGARHHGPAEHHARPAIRGGPGHDVGRDHGLLPGRRRAHRCPGQPVRHR